MRLDDQTVYSFLTGLGNTVRGNLKEANKQRMLSELGAMIQSGDLSGASKSAMAMGDLGSGLTLLKLKTDQEEKARQRAADAQVFGSLAPAATPIATMDGGNTGKRVYDTAISSGASPNEAALLASAAGAESNYNPNAVHDNGTGFGLFGHRLDRLDAMRREFGDRPTLEQQIVFALKELRSRPEGQLVATAKTPEELTRAQMFFERPRGFSPNAPERGDNYSGRLGLTRQFFPGQAHPVQIADAAGAVPISVNDTDISALMTRRANIERALSSPGISDTARTRLNSLLKETDFLITRYDRQEDRASKQADREEARALRRQQFEQQDVATKNRQREVEADRLGLQGDDRLQYITSGRVPSGAEKQTGEQANAATFATRMEAADKILSDPAIYGSGLGLSGVGKQAASKIPIVGNMIVGNSQGGAEFQKYDQAQRDFVNAVLRKESGAAINAAEFDNARKQYFPQPGDTQAVIEQKAANRRTAIDTIAQGAAPSFRKSFSEKRPQNSGGPSVGTVEDGYRFKGGNPADPSSWVKVQ